MRTDHPSVLAQGVFTVEADNEWHVKLQGTVSLAERALADLVKLIHTICSVLHFRVWPPNVSGLTGIGPQMLEYLRVWPQMLQYFRVLGPNVAVISDIGPRMLEYFRVASELGYLRVLASGVGYFRVWPRVFAALPAWWPYANHFSHS